ncbi:hypothetical protein CHARACLAT_032270 [Characodon lateralis]|uniref:Uncharacterized protein n=1 Tax=Characodon lateralis TaxID=208331 RepID=A0ABU7DE55_9TELE|nr:hypothetical protein [Characodon lateralis]
MLQNVPRHTPACQLDSCPPGHDIQWSSTLPSPPNHQANASSPSPPVHARQSMHGQSASRPSAGRYKTCLTHPTVARTEARATEGSIGGRLLQHTKDRALRQPHT